MRQCHALLVAALLQWLTGAAFAGYGREEARDARHRLDYAESRLRDAECELSEAIQARDSAIYSQSSFRVNFDGAYAVFNQATDDLANIHAAIADTTQQLNAAGERLNELNGDIGVARKQFDASVARVNRIQQTAVEQFEASPAHQSAARAIERAEWRLDQLFAIHDWFVFLYDWRLHSPDLPGETIVRRAISEHESAVAHLKNLRDDFEQQLASDPEMKQSDSMVRADEVRLNAMNAEALGLDAERVELTARLQELDRAAMDQRTAVARIQDDLNQWQEQILGSDAAICSAENRVQLAAAEVVCARDFRNDAAGDLRWAIERPDAIVIIPDRGPRFCDDERVEVKWDEEMPARRANGSNPSERRQYIAVDSGEREHRRERTFRNEGDAKNERDRAEWEKNERIEQQKHEREERDRLAQQERNSSEHRKQEEDGRKRAEERKRQNDERKQSDEKKSQDDDRRQAEERKSREDDRKRDEDRKRDDDRKRDEDSRKNSEQNKEDRGKRHERD